jgi:hypothetical protein
MEVGDNDMKTLSPRDTTNRADVGIGNLDAGNNEKQENRERF